jgi:HD-like signal output (HDOD) protein/CheY-like chemotaxis protein
MGLKDMSIKALVVEDDPQVGQVLLHLLKSWQMEGVVASDPQQALKLATDSPFDILITDLVMPGLSGLDLVKKIRQTKPGSRLPVLMMSGKAQKTDVIQASQLGVSSFVAKPFVPDDLKKKIIAACRARRQQDIDQQVKRIWKGRTTLYSDVSGPLVIFGEAIGSLEELLLPPSRHLVAYLGRALEAIARANERQPDLKMGYVLENSTPDIVVHLRKPNTRKWVKLILLSTHCSGNPILIVRLFTINHRDNVPVVLIYDRPEELSSAHREGFKKLGIKLISRSKFDASRFQALIDRCVAGIAPSKPVAPEAEALSPREIHSRVLADIEAMTTLPTLPQVYEKIQTLSRDPKSDLKDWIEVIKIDPLTCAAIFRHVNSLSLGFQGKITDIDRAIILLGKKTVLGLVASEAVRQTFTSVQEKGFILEEFWLHNLATGFAAQILSLPLDPEQASPAQQRELAALDLGEDAFKVLSRVNLPRRLKLDYERENPFVGGIMHDLGKAVMVHSYPGLFPLILEQMEKQKWLSPMLAAEQEVAGGLTHTLAGQILAQQWGLGEDLVNAVLHHHQPEIDNTFAFLIGLADFIAQSLYPFPRQARYPVAPALEEGNLARARAFLPAGFADQPILSLEELGELARAISPRVKHLTENMRQSIQ